MSKPFVNADHMKHAGSTLIDILHTVPPARLDAPTPCTEFDVRALVGHLLYWGPSLAAAGHKRALPPPSVDPRELVRDDWATALSSQVERTVAAWSEPDAWAGATSMGAPTELPAHLIGGMVAGELVVHGWDLSRATGQRPEWDDDLLGFVLDEVTATAQQGREMGVYGPEVVVADSASTLERLLGRTGRDPAWAPPA